MQFCGADQAAQAPVAVIDGYTVFGFDDAQIRRLLAGGVLLDGAAAQVLVKRGYGAYLGIVSAEESDCITSGEVFHTIHHADGREKRMPNRLPAAQLEKTENRQRRRDSSAPWWPVAGSATRDWFALKTAWAAGWPFTPPMVRSDTASTTMRAHSK